MGRLRLARPPIESENVMRFVCAVLAILTSGMSVCSEASRSPNISVILADDLGYGDLGCYGADDVSTPHIDSLCRDGLKLTDFHSAGPMCSPTRASLLTGLYPQRFGPKFDGALSGTRDRDMGLPREATTIAERLKAGGYATGCAK